MGRAVLKKSSRKNATKRRAPLEPRRLRTPRTLHDLAPDPNNRRVHPARNVQMIRNSLESVGAARSIVIDERNEVLAGSGVLQAATAAGMTKLQIIDTDGDTLVAVRRIGLTKNQKRALALADNRTGELSEWDQLGLAQDVAAGVDLLPFFTDDELRKLLPDAATEHDVNFKAVDETVATEHTCPKCGYEWSGKG